MFILARAARRGDAAAGSEGRGGGEGEAGVRSFVRSPLARGKRGLAAARGGERG